MRLSPSFIYFFFLEGGVVCFLFVLIVSLQIHET